MEQTIPNDTKFWVALSRVPQLRIVWFRRLESHSGKLETVWNASLTDLKVAGLEDRPG
jgi:predicted Rossmann fold nucleotide-binding protein DprA/Smf involved in DNA uptake